jgi:hypothetical protein
MALITYLTPPIPVEMPIHPLERPSVYADVPGISERFE